jgi:transposase
VVVAPERIGVLPNTNDQVEVANIMRPLEPEVHDAVWAAAEPLITGLRVLDSHPLGCHRPRISDRICFEAMLYRLVLGCSWVDVERLMDGRVSDTTLRARRDEWETAGIWTQVAEEALAAYDKIIGLDLSDVAVDGSMHKAPCGGEGTGRNFNDRGRVGWKWSILTEAEGIPLGWAADGANRHDTVLFDPTLDAVKARGLHLDIETLHLDAGYDSATVRDACAAAGIDDVLCPKNPRKSKKKRGPKMRGRRWPVERTNSWLTNFGQLRRSTDRRTAHRLSQLALAIALLITAKLIDWRNRWSPAPVPGA